MVGSVCLVERFTTEWKKFRWWRRSWNGGAELAETTVKRLLCCPYRSTDKAMGQLYQCWWRICREINVSFFRFEYHMFYVLHVFVSYLLNLPRMLRPAVNPLVCISVKHPSGAPRESYVTTGGLTPSSSSWRQVSWGSRREIFPLTYPA
jgi:hypothetical protein